MSWKDVLKKEEKFRYFSRGEEPLKEEYKDDFPPRSILDKGLEMLRAKLEKLIGEAEATDWTTESDKIFAYIDTPKITVYVKLERPFLTDYLGIHINQVPITRKTREMNHDVYIINKEILEFYKSHSPIEAKTYTGSSPHTWP